MASARRPATDIRVQLRLAYEMNRQLLTDSDMSLSDYDALTALSVADGGRMQITVLAASSRDCRSAWWGR